MNDVKGFPSQRIPRTRKTKTWRQECVDWADKKLTANYNYVRNSIRHKQINYDLLNGKIHMSDLHAIMNPEGVKAEFIPDKIAHYPIMLSKINVLRGEEAKRVFDYRVIVTNPTSISEIENNKKEALLQDMQQLIQNTAQSEEEFNQQLEKLNTRYLYEWQDEREIRGNAVLNHYSKEINMPAMFNAGIVDAMAVSEEIYQCDIIGGEPTVERVNPKKIEILRSGFSNKVEDADMIIISDYWSPGRIIDTYGEILTDKEIKQIEECTNLTKSNETTMYPDERNGFVNRMMLDEEFDPRHPLEFVDTFSDRTLFAGNAPFDSMGNIKVLRVYWKSYRQIQKVKSYDAENGEEVFNFYTDEYTPNKDLGEEVVAKYYINEAWEGTKIGENIYKNMRPRVIQYNRLTNPSRCHFGIIGTVYNINEERPYSLVDMMKQYNYLYDVIHDRLNRLIARNWGKLVRLDASKKPGKWSVDKWLYYAKQMGLVIEDSFNAGTEGYALGKLAGAMNNASTGVIDAELGNTIQQYINILEFIKLEMSEVCGITRQREGQISNRETVGGVERATLQSSHITEWLFVQHEDLKKRVLEAFLETAKIAMKGRNMKFPYILSDHSMRIMDIDGDEFAESDYGLVVDNSQQTQEFASKIDMFAQAAMQNQLTSFSTIFKLYSTASLAEKQRLVEQDEQQIQQRQQQHQQQQLEQQQQIAEQQMQMEQQKLMLQDQMNQRDNETKIMIAAMNQESQDDGIIEPEYSQEAKERLAETIREFDQRIQLDRDRLEFDKSKANTDASLKRRQIEVQKSRAKTTTKK